MRALTLLSLCLSMLGGACAGDPAAREAVLQISVGSDGDKPLQGVPVEVDGVRVAVSDAQGRARATVQASSATRARVGVSCPQGYRSLEPRSVPLGRGTHAPVLELKFICRPTLRSVVVVVRAPLGEGLMLRADGEPVGRVGADGTLHITLTRAPDTELRLMLDTNGQKNLQPQNPVREIRVADRDEIVVFDQPLSVARPIRGHPRQAPRKEVDAARHIPYAIGRHD